MSFLTDVRAGRRSAHEPRSRGAQSVTKPVVLFAITGITAVAALGFLSVHILQGVGQREAIRDAKHETQLAGLGIVAPQLRPGFLTGQSAALARVNDAVRAYVLRDPVVRVKIWDGSGRILYSDEPRLIGSRYPLKEDERNALAGGTVDAEVSDLAKPENRFERPFNKLLEVYQGMRGPDGRPLLYEEYLRYSSVAASGNRLWGSFGPALLATLALLWLAQIPLAWSLARRLRRRQQERETLLRRAVEASDVERRRIARDLHDGVVQNLAGVSYTLSAAAASVRDGSPRSAPAVIDRAAAEVRESIRELRSLLVDIYPPTLRQAGLAGAISDLVAPLIARDIETEVDLDPDLGLPPDREPILYRVAQEALRNVAKHSGASHVRVQTTRRNGTATLTVEDDGRGFAPAEAARPNGKEHFGLRILEDLARDSGGRLTIDSTPGAGTRVRIEVPVD